jgi:hypothetical protein
VAIAAFGSKAVWRRLLPALIGLCVGCLPAWADEGARTRFALPAIADEGEKEVPFETLFYSRAANFEAFVRLRDTFRITDNPANEEIPAGTLLYRVRTERDIYYCSNRMLRKPTAADMASLLATAALPLVRTHLPSDNSPQCFRDTDGDGRFDQRSGSIVPIGSIATAMAIVNVQPLATPLAYEVADVPEPVLEIGLKGTVRNPKRGTFLAEACMHVKKSEFSTEEETCFRYGDTAFRLKELPMKLKFLDGEITINELSQGADGAWRARYVISKPIAATAIDPVKWIGGGGVEYELRYIMPDGKASKQR